MLVERVFVEGGTVHVTARIRDDLVVDCPGCGTAAHRVHSRYQRHLADIAAAGRPVVIDLSVRRLVCDRPTCPRRTFVEQVEGLTVRCGRRTPSLHRLLVAIALALAGRAGARMAAVLAVAVSRVTLISMLTALPDPPATKAASSPPVLGGGLHLPQGPDLRHRPGRPRCVRGDRCFPTVPPTLSSRG